MASIPGKSACLIDLTERVQENSVRRRQEYVRSAVAGLRIPEIRAIKGYTYRPVYRWLHAVALAAWHRYWDVKSSEQVSVRSYANNRRG